MQKGINNPCYEKLNKLVGFMLKSVAHFDIFDWAILKTCLVSFGILIGSMFAKIFKKLAPLMAIIVLASWAYIAWRIFFIEDNE